MEATVKKAALNTFMAERRIKVSSVSSIKMQVLNFLIDAR